MCPLIYKQRSTSCVSPLSHCMPTMNLTYHRRAKFCGIIVLNFAWDKPQMETMVVQNSFKEKHITGAPNDNFRENICSEGDLRSRIFGAFVVTFLACLPLLGFSNI